MAKGQVWNGTRWVWPNEDHTPVGPNDAGGPAPVPNADIMTNASQARAYVATALEQCGELTGLGITGGEPFTVDYLLTYGQQRGTALRSLLTAINTCLITIQGIANA